MIGVRAVFANLGSPLRLALSHSFSWIAPPTADQRACDHAGGHELNPARDSASPVQSTPAMGWKELAATPRVPQLMGTRLS
jgi:hypothetical protein